MQSHIKCFLFLFMVTVLFPGCFKSSNHTTQFPSLSTDTALEASKTVETNNPHDPANPPIDCPLRKQSINPHDMKPFEDTQKYIDFLERSDRAVWQKPEVIINELNLSGAETIADVGAGSGYFSFRFAHTLPKGKVFAIDIEPEMLRHIHHKSITEGKVNIEIIKADFDDPNIPAGVDIVFICDVLHHIKERGVWLKKLSAEMGKGAKLVVVEFKEGDLPEGPPASLKISKNKLIAMISENNFKLDLDKSDLLPYQVFLFFSKR